MTQELFCVIVCGGRYFKNKDMMWRVLDKLLANKTNVEFVNGGQVTEEKDEYGNVIAKYGADHLARVYAEEHGYGIKIYDAQWAVHGKAAGPLRNEDMAAYAHACVAFWDGESRGTADMLRRAKAHNIPIRIKRY